MCFKITVFFYVNLVFNLKIGLSPSQHSLNTVRYIMDDIMSGTFYQHCLEDRGSYN